MASSHGALAAIKRESHPAYSAGWLPTYQLGGDANEDSIIALNGQRWRSIQAVPRILQTHWWREDSL